MSRRLTTKDLRELIDALWDARNEWDFIGLALELSIEEISEIKGDNTKTRNKYSDMLESWLKKGKDCTWNSLCNALSRKSVGHCKLADSLRQKYLQLPDQTQKESEIESQPQIVSEESLPPSNDSERDLPTPMLVSPQASPQVQCRGVVDNGKGVCQDKLAGPKGYDHVHPTTNIHTMGGKESTSSVNQEQAKLQIEKDGCAPSQNTTPMDTTPAKSSPSPCRQPHAKGTRELCFKEGLELRGYQKELADSGLRGENYIMVAPTGSGKTLVAGYIIMTHLNKMAKEDKKGKVTFITPTRQLTEQQRDRLREYIPGIGVGRITGMSGKPMQPFIKNDGIDVIVSTAGKLRQEITEKDAVAITDFSLIIFDECHHAGRPSNYSDIMEFYIKKKKQQSAILPQIVGLTASPGAGRGKSLDETKVKDHLLSLCAVLDAKSGFKVVKENIAELQAYRNDPESSLEVSEERDVAEPFFQCVERAMKKLEPLIGIVLPYPKASPDYISMVQNKKKGEDPVKVLVLEQLRVYSKSLATYSEFRYEDAIHILEESSQIFTQQEIHEEMMRDLRVLPIRPLNPLLERMELILQKQFEKCPESKGIIFVREVKHTKYIMNWIKSSPSLSKIIKVNSVAGYSHEESTKRETTAILKGFREDTYNVLASTSVLEEGLDVSKCNFVVRYQNVSNEIAQVQAKGRARAEGSKMYTIVASGSNWHDAYILQERKQCLVNKSLSTLPQESVEKHIAPWQKEFLEKRERKAKQLEILQSRWPDQDKVKICCGKCGTLACLGSELCAYTLTEDQVQYVIHAKEFADHYERKDHEKPVFRDSFVKRYKIFCRSCVFQWGVIMEWKDTGYVYPALKCEHFTFKYQGESQNFKRWKDICFKVRSIQDLPDYEEDVTPDETAM